jgi:magnesium transporter
MLRVHDPDARRLRPATDLPASGWLDVDDPGDDERRPLEELGIPPELVDHALDDDELPRTLRRGEATLVVVRSSRPAADDARMPFCCPPLGIVLVGERVVTIGRRNGDVLGRAAARWSPDAGARGLMIAIFAVIAERFLAHLAELERRVDELEERLQESQENAEVMGLLRIQRSLTVFATSLEMNEGALAWVREGVLDDGRHHAALEDALTELRQARQLASTSSHLLGGMMDAFASIISININEVAKLLSALAVVLFSATLLATIYGMNVRLPLADRPDAFWLLAAMSGALAAAPALWFWRNGWLRPTRRGQA